MTWEWRGAQYAAWEWGPQTPPEPTEPTEEADDVREHLDHLTAHEPAEQGRDQQ